jgi:hypothetical protein
MTSADETYYRQIAEVRHARICELLEANLSFFTELKKALAQRDAANALLLESASTIALTSLNAAILNLIDKHLKECR